jgi:NAD(P)H-hydrate epimerase
MVYVPVATQLQSAMVQILEPDKKLSSAHTGLLLGPGLADPELAEPLRLALRTLWRDLPHPVIVDASAIDWLPLHATPRHPIRVITPHPGEAARLLRSTPVNVQKKRVDSLREISRLYGNAWVVLKGHHTLIGRSSGSIFVNSSGNPGLAQGGSGDVLAGFLAGLLAQPANQEQAGWTIRYAVYEHGAAADRLESARPNWVIEDLVEELGRVPLRRPAGF